MEHLNAYIARKLADGPRDLELTREQKGEIAHHCFNPMTVMQYDIAALRSAGINVDRLERAFERVRDYLKLITKVSE